MHYEVVAAFSGTRLDKAISLSGAFTRSRLQYAKNITLNGREAKLSQKICTGDVITFDLDESVPNFIEPRKMPLDIIYENDDVLVLNKASGVPVHPSYSHYDDTLVNGVMEYLGMAAISIPKNCSENALIELSRVGVVHRLDAATSGVIIFTKNDRVKHFLQAQFAAHTVKKCYKAVVVTKNILESATIEYDLGRDLKERKRFAAYKDGELVRNGCEKTGIFLSGGESLKAAITQYNTIKKNDNYRYLDVRIKTGRTHQIRVHLAAIGVPVAGDVIYGRDPKKNKFKRLMLHSKSLAILLPGEKDMRVFNAPLGEDFLNGLKLAAL